jgi:hypothetical protein
MLTLTKIDEDVWGRTLVKVYNIKLDNSYATNGYKSSLGFNAHAFGLSAILGMHLIGLDAATSGVCLVSFDYTNIALMAFRTGTATPAGTVAAPTFTGDALAAHRHVLHFQTSAAANAVTAAANALRTAAAAFDVAGVANSSGEGGVVDVTGGTPTGTNSAPAFTGTAIGQKALAEVSNAVDLSAVTARFVVFGKNH